MHPRIEDHAPSMHYQRSGLLPQKEHLLGLPGVFVGCLGRGAALKAGKKQERTR